MTEKLRGLMGLAMRAGQITLGANLGINVIRSGKAALVLIDEDASENTRKKLTDACVYRHVPFFTLPHRLIDDACGKDSRYAAVFQQGGLAEKVRQLLISQGKPDLIDQQQNCAERGGASVE
jgi:ribosomal protein L7Ae-like RNA K-turn-binding protein